MNASYEPLTKVTPEEELLPRFSQFVYELTQDEDGYGVLLKSGEDGEVLFSVRSVSPDEGRVRAFVALCNRLSLSATHFYDVIEDFVS